MKKHIVKSAMLALMTTSLMAPTAFAGEPTPQDKPMQGQYHKGQHKGHHGFMHGMLRGLDLTEQQKSEINKLMDEKKAARKDKRLTAEERQAHKAQMLELVTSESFDEAKVLAAMKEREAKRELGMLEMIKLQRSVYQLLTPEQQTQFKENFNKRGMRKGDRP
ncbi:Spy/CpxP family protein refolding chaperone [Shewanella sp. AS1]|uniref:Spy/CpxP family protein refolding chaperone n=1 Tax=Shewanella sp. AS1 TaxID=2907626 RepID=UPI001F2D6E31|nr:Spy/CpxP family protein refolding chaperone [Shewanella sp. AS1]MCE9680106.1 Spy/CpxP family protein refolding chaperone [Shewanella sp. AS1]